MPILYLMNASSIFAPYIWWKIYEYATTFVRSTLQFEKDLQHALLSALRFLQTKVHFQ